MAARSSSPSSRSRPSWRTSTQSSSTATWRPGTTSKRVIEALGQPSLCGRGLLPGSRGGPDHAAPRRTCGPDDLPEQDRLQRPLPGEPRGKVQRPDGPLQQPALLRPPRTCTRARRPFAGSISGWPTSRRSRPARSRATSSTSIRPTFRSPTPPTSLRTCRAASAPTSSDASPTLFAKLAGRGVQRDAVELGHPHRPRALSRLPHRPRARRPVHQLARLATR